MKYSNEIEFINTHRDGSGCSASSVSLCKFAENDFKSLVDKAWRNLPQGSVADPLKGALFGLGAGALINHFSPIDDDMTTSERKSRRRRTILKSILLGTIGGIGVHIGKRSLGMASTQPMDPTAKWWDTRRRQKTDSDKNMYVGSVYRPSRYRHAVDGISGLTKSPTGKVYGVFQGSDGKYRYAVDRHGNRVVY